MTLKSHRFGTFDSKKSKTQQKKKKKKKIKKIARKRAQVVHIFLSSTQGGGRTVRSVVFVSD